MKTYKQSTNAIIISYVLYKWLIACMTIGISALYDWLNYRNTKLTFENKFITFVTGGFVTHSKEIPYEDIMKVNVDQSIIGQWFNYGTVNIKMKETDDIVSFKYVHAPEVVRKAVQDMYVRSAKLKML